MGGKGSGGLRPGNPGGRPTTPHTLRTCRLSVRLSWRAKQALDEYRRRTGLNLSDSINWILEGAAAPRAVTGGRRHYE